MLYRLTEEYKSQDKDNTAALRAVLVQRLLAPTTELYELILDLLVDAIQRPAWEQVDFLRKDPVISSLLCTFCSYAHTNPMCLDMERRIIAQQQQVKVEKLLALQKLLQEQTNG